MEKAIQADTDFWTRTLSYLAKPVTSFDREKRGTREITYAEARAIEAVTLSEMRKNNGSVLVGMTNKSPWNIVLSSQTILYGGKKNSLLSITFILCHHSRAVLPAHILRWIFYDHDESGEAGQCLRYFKANDRQAGLLVKTEQGILARREGNFPLVVEVLYQRYAHYEEVKRDGRRKKTDRQGWLCDMRRLRQGRGA